MKKLIAVLSLVTALSGSLASAQSTYQAVLSGVNETTPNGSTATGLGIVVLNAAQNQITVDLSWTGLAGPPTGAHIHGPGGQGTNAGVIFPFASVPSVASGAIPQQSFAINATQVGYLQNGWLYMNLHDSAFPAGEIRGQLVPVPEPATVMLLGLGLVGLLFVARRR